MNSSGLSSEACSGAGMGGRAGIDWVRVVLGGMGTATADAPVTALAWQPDGKILTSGHADGSLAFWHVEVREHRCDSLCKPGLCQPGLCQPGLCQPGLCLPCLAWEKQCASLSPGRLMLPGRDAVATAF